MKTEGRSNSQGRTGMCWQLALVTAVALCTAWSACANDISYNYWNVGASLSNRDSEYLTRDSNLYLDVNFSKTVHEFLSDEHQSGIHFWIDVTQSKDLSDDSSYELQLFQSAIGLGAHYSRDEYSVYFRLGGGGSGAQFKAVSTGSSVPPLSAASGDIFVPPQAIFSADRAKTTTTNSEYGAVGKVGIRYKAWEKYEVGASLSHSNLESFGTEVSAYIQRDFTGSGVRTTSTFGFSMGQLSIRADVVATEALTSAGVSLAYTF